MSDRIFRVRGLGHLLSVLLVASLAVGCDDDDDDRDDAGFDAGGAALSDAQVAGIAEAINAGEIAEGRLAQTRASREDVRDYADRMVEDHTEANDDLMELLNDRGLAVANSATRSMLQTASQQSQARLSGLSGVAFDQAYITAQVEMHAEALRIIDAQLLPRVSDDDLRDYLEELRETVADHLETAQEIRADLADELDGSLGGLDGGTGPTGDDVDRGDDSTD